MSVDTYVDRRRQGAYQALDQDGVEVLLATPLVEQARNITVDMKRFLFFPYLKARVELDNGLVV